MSPVPGYVRLLALLTGAVSVLWILTVLAAGAAFLARVTATVDQRHSFSVGERPAVSLHFERTTLAVEPGPAGRVELEERLSAASLTRQGALAALGRMETAAARAGDRLDIRFSAPFVDGVALDRHSALTLRVPVETDLELTGWWGRVEVRELAGRLRLHSQAGSSSLEGTTLAAGSDLSAEAGELRLERVTVGGDTSLTVRSGDLRFSGSLAPGGTRLDVQVDGGHASVSLPYPTDARADVAVQAGAFRADDTWHFATSTGRSGERATADLGPSPRGLVTVRVQSGEAEFLVR